MTNKTREVFKRELGFFLYFVLYNILLMAFSSFFHTNAGMSGRIRDPLPESEFISTPSDVELLFWIGFFVYSFSLIARIIVWIVDKVTQKAGKTSV